MRTYTPRRCSKRWLDTDCPAEVLCIFDYGPSEPAERYDVFYAELVSGEHYHDGWIGFLSCDEDGRYSHGEMEAYKVAEYRYRRKHRYATWSSLPDAVKDRVKYDLGLCGECGQSAPLDDCGRPRDTVGGQAMCEKCLADYLAENGVTS